MRNKIGLVVPITFRKMDHHKTKASGLKSGHLHDIYPVFQNRITQKIGILSFSNMQQFFGPMESRTSAPKRS